MPTERWVDTDHGPARALVHPAARPGDAAGLLVLGHGAGGGVEAPDLLAVAAAATGTGWEVALVEQPYRVARRRLPPRAGVLDDAWCRVVDALVASGGPAMTLVVGGRSSGARVACRTARRSGAGAVAALAFPLRPPARGGRPRPPDRFGELREAGVPVLVVQGERDPFGAPADFPAVAGLQVVAVPGDHSMRRAVEPAAMAVAAWLAAIAAARG